MKPSTDTPPEQPTKPRTLKQSKVFTFDVHAMEVHKKLRKILEEHKKQEESRRKRQEEQKKQQEEDQRAKAAELQEKTDALRKQLQELQSLPAKNTVEMSRVDPKLWSQWVSPKKDGPRAAWAEQHKRDETLRDALLDERSKDKADTSPKQRCCVIQ